MVWVVLELVIVVQEDAGDLREEAHAADTGETIAWDESWAEAYKCQGMMQKRLLDNQQWFVLDALKHFECVKCQEPERKAEYHAKTFVILLKALISLQPSPLFRVRRGRVRSTGHRRERQSMLIGAWEVHHVSGGHWDDDVVRGQHQELHPPIPGICRLLKKGLVEIVIENEYFLHDPEPSVESDDGSQVDCKVNLQIGVINDCWAGFELFWHVLD